MSPRRKAGAPAGGEEVGPVSPAVAAVLSGLPAALVQAATRGAPSVSLRLERLGSRTRALETNVARSPIFSAPSRGALQLSLAWDEEELPFLGGTFVVRESRGPLSPREEHLLGALHTAYIRAGCPEDRRVSLSLGEAAAILGHGRKRRAEEGKLEPGGRNRELVKESLRRIAAVQLESTVRYRDERGRAQQDTFGYRLVDKWHTTTREGGRGAVVISDTVAALLASGSVTYMDGPTWAALLDADLLAARLWTFLEAEFLGQGRRYSLWASRPGEPPRERDSPALVDLLRLRNRNRSEVAARIRKACAVIARHDPRYRLEVVRSPELGMWRLEARREGPQVGTSVYRRRAPAVPGRDPDGCKVGTLMDANRDPDLSVRAGNGGVPSSLPSPFTVVEEGQDKTDERPRPRPLAELIGALDLGPRPDPSPAPSSSQVVPPEVVEARRARARAILEAATTDAEREAARRHLEDEES